jgi:hypothetical protein
MPGLYIAIACIFALIAAMELGRRLLYRFNKLHWLTGTTFWFGLAWVMAAVTSLVVGSVVDWVIWTVVMALGQTLIMSFASWIILKFRLRGRAIIRSWVLAGISLAAGCFTIWKVSFFFGLPRDLMGFVLQQKAPWIFYVHDVSTHAWTDFTARMKIEFPPGALAKAVEGLSKRDGNNGRVIYSWELIQDGRIQVSCTIETDPDHTFAEIAYGAD